MDWHFFTKRGRTSRSASRSSPRQRRYMLVLEALERRETPAPDVFAPGAYLIDMGQPTQTVGNALKPYGLVYDMVTNFKVPVNWAINPAKTTFRLDAGDPIPVDFTATITTGTKSYSGGSFIIDAAFLTPAVIAAINTWKAQGVVVDTLAAPLTTEILRPGHQLPARRARCPEREARGALLHQRGGSGLVLPDRQSDQSGSLRRRLHSAARRPGRLAGRVATGPVQLRGRWRRPVGRLPLRQ